MKKFRLVSDVEFYANDSEHAKKRLALHFKNAYSGRKSNILTGGKISLFEYPIDLSNPSLEVLSSAEDIMLEEKEEDENA